MKYIRTSKYILVASLLFIICVILSVIGILNAIVAGEIFGLMFGVILFIKHILKTKNEKEIKKSL